MSTEEFEIKIIAVEKDRIRESAVVKGGWVIPFKLSAKPNESWERHFYETHRKNTDPKKKDVKIVIDCIEVQFTENDSLQKALEMLKVDVDSANAAYKDIYLKKIQIQEDLRALQLKQVGVLQKLKDESAGLKFE